MDVNHIPPMPPTDDREDFEEDPDHLGFGYLESNISWACRNNEAIEWLIENHQKIRHILKN